MCVCVVELNILFYWCCQMYTEIIAALEQAAKNDTVITVFTGTHIIALVLIG